MRALFALLVMGSAVQAGTFTPPSSCEVFLTMQGRGCFVEHYWTCSYGKPGDSWSVTFHHDGATFYGQVDHEAQWVKSYFPREKLGFQLESPVEDTASMTELLETGLDAFDFTQSSSNGLRRVIGYDKIVERDLMIDGEPLHRTEYSVRATDETGNLLFESEGSEFVSEKYRRFFTGKHTYSEGAETLHLDDTPVEFIYPGQEGFLSDTPIYDCAVSTVRYEPN